MSASWLNGKIPAFFFGRIRHTAVVHGMILMLVGFFAYANTFDAQFNFDDVPAILGNPTVRSAESVTDPLAIRGNRAVGNFSFALNYKIAAELTGDGFSVRGYHYFNLAVHLANALLVYLLVILTIRRSTSGESSEWRGRGIAFLAALLFVSHPLQTQAVTYIVQRFTSLATTFYLLSLVCYIFARSQRGDSTGGHRLKAAVFWALSIVLAALAMGTKEIAITLPFTIILYEFLFFRGSIVKRLLAAGAFLLTLIIVPLSIIGASGGHFMDRIAALTKVQTAMPRLDYLFTQFKVVATYLRLLFFPAGQNLEYDFPVSHSFFEGGVILSFLLLLALFCLGVYFLYRSKFEVRSSRLEVGQAYSPVTNHQSPITNHRLIAFGIFWFFITLSVESSFIPIVDVIFEHRVYLPSVGFFIAVATLIVLGVEKLSLGRPRAANGLLVAMLLLSCVLALLTFNRNRVWADEITLWEDVAAKSPNLSRPWNNLGYAYLKHRQPKKAIPALITSITISPGSPDAWNNIGMALSQLGSYTGRFSPTYELFDMSAGITSTYQSEWFALAYNNLGLAYDSMGQVNESIENFQKAISMNPRLAQAYYNLGLAFLAMKDKGQAADQYRMLRSLDPELAAKLREAVIGDW
ncbi:tetratricopeptide repeat protein [Geotalea toluenoxydans]